jgi:hypothetical protein
VPAPRRGTSFHAAIVGLSLLALSGAARGNPRAIHWARLQPGLTYAAVVIDDPQGGSARPVLHVVRADPTRAPLVAVLAAQDGRKTRTTSEWARRHRLAVAINLGMYYGNHLTHVGYLRSGAFVNSRRWLPRYDSVLAVARDRAMILDRARPFDASTLASYDVVVQNLRLIKSADGRKGENVWTRQEKRWSEAAIAIDRQGHILFIFCREPLSMWELNQALLRLPLGVVRAMHVEGGPEASLSIHAGGVSLDLCGSFETGFFPSDLNKDQWAIPNVLGVRRTPPRQ